MTDTFILRRSKSFLEDLPISIKIIMPRTGNIIDNSINKMTASMLFCSGIFLDFMEFFSLKFLLILSTIAITPTMPIEGIQDSIMTAKILSQYSNM